MPRTPQNISIRLAYPDDAATLRRLAALDSSPTPQGAVLVAEVDGELRAALSLSDGQVVADPFRPTTEVVALLRVHAELADGRSGLRATTGLLRALLARRPALRTAAQTPSRVSEPPVSLTAYPLLRAH
jgi:hypothetical protein